MKEDCNIREIQYDRTNETIVLDNTFEIVSIEEYSEEVIDALTKDKLKKATSIVYCCDYDSDPYNYQLKCVIGNNGLKADVSIYFGVDFVEQYVFDSPIKIDEYNSILRRLEIQDIRNVIKKGNGLERIFDESSINLSSSFIIMDGRQTFSLYVKKGDELLFKGIPGENLSIAKGQLEDSFIEFLPQYMKDAIFDPETFLNNSKYSVPPPCCLDDSSIEEIIDDGQIITCSSFNKETACDDDGYIV